MLESSQPNIIALIPAFNEQYHLGQVLTGARRYLPALVVDDGSTDQTGSVAETGGAILVRQTPNQGKGAALRTGFRYALEHGFQAVVTLDADGQHDPHEIPAFLDYYLQYHTDLIIGARDFSKIPPIRRVANTLGRLSFSWALGQSILDNQSGYRLLSRRMLQAVLSSQEQGFEFEVEMIVTCVESGYTMGWVPIKTIYANEKSHIQPVHHVINYSRVILQTWRRRMTVKE
jgi:glycosyltransferase involved in cell wall biosynthesis